ncbi:hypothetical protein MXB_4212, partial [Myxobolus squamalis]
MPFQFVNLKSCKEVIERKARFSVGSKKGINKKLQLSKILPETCITGMTFIIFQATDINSSEAVLSSIRNIIFPTVLKLTCTYEELIMTQITKHTNSSHENLVFRNQIDLHKEMIKFICKNQIVKMVLHQKHLHLFKGKFKVFKKMELDVQITTNLGKFQKIMSSIVNEDLIQLF